MFQIFILLAYYCNPIKGSDDTNCSKVRITTHFGLIDGFVDETLTGRIYAAFEGIPYAAPPIGRLRFDAPQALKAWVGVWQANTLYKCLQYIPAADPNKTTIAGQEDCLYLNIYTPHPENTANLDVIVFIHDGNFMQGHAGDYGPKIIMDRHIVFVSINYRLGPFGFLTTEDDIQPGNMGLKDQIMALTWIKTNIKQFGGNPNSITIAGLGAGAACVQFLYLTPQSKGLFHKGIAQSGSVLNPWALMKNGYRKTMKLADMVGCPSDKSAKAVECLRYRPAEQIIKGVIDFLGWQCFPSIPFGPVVDIWAETPLLSRFPYTMLKDGMMHNHPLMMSHVASEGLHASLGLISNENCIVELNNNWNGLIPFIMDYNETVDEIDKDFISEALLHYYMHGKSLSLNTVSHFIKMVSDRRFIVDIQKSARLHAAASFSPVYYYIFTFQCEQIRTYINSKPVLNLGASHGDDTSFLLEMNGCIKNKNTEAMSYFLLDMWTSFACDGKPYLPDELYWPPVSVMSAKHALNFIEIRSCNDIIIGSNDNLGNYRFWIEMPIRENENLLGKGKDEL